MKTFWAIIGMMLLCILLAGCVANAPVCTPPYIVSGKTCCPDRNGDGICDAANATGAAPEALDCRLCPPQFVTQKEEVPVYRYVCPNQTVVSKPEYCGVVIASNAKLFVPNTAQDSKYVTSFDANPACRGSIKAAELHLVLAQSPVNVTLEVEDAPDAMPYTMLTTPGKEDFYYYIGFCDGICGPLVSAQLPPTTAYLVRAVLHYPNRTVSTRDIILDPTPEGVYGKKRCI